MNNLADTVDLKSPNLTGYQVIGRRVGGNYQSEYNKATISEEAISPQMLGNNIEVTCSDLETNVEKDFVLNLKVGNKLVSNIVLTLVIGGETLAYTLKRDEVFYKDFKIFSRILKENPTVHVTLTGIDKYNQTFKLESEYIAEIADNCNIVDCSSNNGIDYILFYNTLKNNIPILKVTVGNSSFVVSSVEELIEKLNETGVVTKIYEKVENK